MITLNEVFSKPSARRRYEVWFLRMGLRDGSGAWWFRYLYLNPGRLGCSEDSRAQPVQIWASWFPTGGAPQSFIQGFSLDELDLSSRGHAPFHFRVGTNSIEENHCQGSLRVGGHHISWTLQYRSTFRVTLSSKGWIGFSRTPHSDALFSGSIELDGRRFAGDPLGFGVQGHNCGYRHRTFWTWAHAYFSWRDSSATTLEALTYDMPVGLVFRKAVLWHNGQQYALRKLHNTSESEKMLWDFRCAARNGLRLHATIDGRGQSALRLPYSKTDCSGTFEVANNSLASASLVLERDGHEPQRLDTANGAVLEVVG